MPTELVIRKWCDEDWDNGKEVVGEKVGPLTIVGLTTPKEIVLCDRCRDIVTFNRLLELIEKYGTKPEAKAGPLTRRTPPTMTAGEVRSSIMKGEDWECPFCSAVLIRGSASQHLVNKHGITIQQPNKCPECDFKNSNAGSMRIHRQRGHGWDQIEEMIRIGLERGAA